MIGKLRELATGGILSQTPIAFGYSNARVKAMRTHLLTRAQFEEMARVKSVPEIIEMLERTHFKQDLVALSLKFSGVDLVRVALGKNAARTYRKLIRITPESGRGTVLAFLRRWDVHNLKTILLGKSMGYSTEKIESLLVPAGEIGEDELKRLAGSDLESVVGFLKRCEFCPPKESWENQVKKGDLSPLMNELDRVYYKELASKVKGVGRDGGTVLSLVKAEIDAKNIMLGIRARREQIPTETIEKLLLDGGSISKRELVKIAETKSTEEAVRKLSRHYDLTEAFESYKTDRSLVHFETHLENWVAQKGVKALRRSMLSVGALVGYVYLKNAEIGNIRKILSAAEFGIPEEKLKGMLVIAG